MSPIAQGMTRGRPAACVSIVCRRPACASRQAYQIPRRPAALQPTLGRRFFSQQTPRRHSIEWRPIPIGLGIGFLGVFQIYRSYIREPSETEDGGVDRQPAQQPRARLDGPWQVQIMSTLPLKALSRLWGRFNELTIPYYLRVPGFKLYAFIFGVNLAEVEEADLANFPNLAAFFYRTIKPGARPLDPNPTALLSPADGRVLQFGQIHGGDIEQVKGITYTIDALLGDTSPVTTASVEMREAADKQGPAARRLRSGEELVKEDEEFARVNGISYTLPDLLTGSKKSTAVEDRSVTPSAASVSEVRADLALGEKRWWKVLTADRRHALYYVVVYLAPGDYHRFHSPTNWVVERRRHFAGELYSVSPYLQRTLPGLFTLNERVVLLGRWRYGFLGYVPVGATNVGSIKINFDRELRTNSLTTDTPADKAAKEATDRGEPYLGYSEATYETASPVLQGHALRRGEEMGGFQLGSTIVMIFEAPVTETDESAENQKGWTWSVEKGQKVKVGQALGLVLA